MKQREFDENLAREITAGVGSARGCEIVTRDGRPARIVSWNAKGSHPIVALVDLGPLEKAHQYTIEGKIDSRDNVKTNSDLLINMPDDE